MVEGLMQFSALHLGFVPALHNMPAFTSKHIRFIVRDKKGAKQDLQNLTMAYKRREFQVSQTIVWEDLLAP